MATALHLARLRRAWAPRAGRAGGRGDLIEIPDEDFSAFRLQLWVSSTKDESWEVTAVVNLEPAGDNEDVGGIVEGG